MHEAYLRLVGPGQPETWEGRSHFLAAAAESMRRILIERARSKSALKRGGDRRRVSLDDAAPVLEQPADQVLALDEALNDFARVAPQKAELVKLRFYAGLTIPEAAEALGVSHATAERYWTYARTWLYCRLNNERGPDENAKNRPAE